jgi:tetratricopeptide (TPR) repeat protein
VASETSDNLRHSAFFTELAAREDGDSSWRAVTAGLVVLRLVDAWVAEGADVIAADSWGVRSVRAAIEDMPEGMPARTLLTGVVDALTSARGGDLHAVAPRLMAYARSLDLDGRWTLAADVYDTILTHVHPVDEADVVVNALLRRAHCLRQMGELAEASAVYATAAEVATRASDIIGSLRARIGEAKVLADRGNLPAADAMLESTADVAGQHSLSDVRATATHDRSHVAYLRGRYDAAVRFAYDAMRESTNEHERERILNDLATAFSTLGVKSAARDAFMILAATAREQYLRWTATINLLELAAEDGVRLQFERYRQQLAGAGLPPLLQVHYELHVGRGYQALGEPAQAQMWLERAAGTAAAHSFNKLAFEAGDALEKNTRPVQRTPAVAFEVEIPDDVGQIAQEIRELRELAGV